MPPPPPPHTHHCSEMAHTVRYTNSSKQQQHSDIAQITLPNKQRMQYKNHAVHQVLSLQPNEAFIDVLLSTKSKKKPLCHQANMYWRKKATDWLGRWAKLDKLGQKVWSITSFDSKFAVYGARAVKFTAVGP